MGFSAERDTHAAALFLAILPCYPLQRLPPAPLLHTPSFYADATHYTRVCCAITASTTCFSRSLSFFVPAYLSVSQETPLTSQNENYLRLNLCSPATLTPVPARTCIFTIEQARLVSFRQYESSKISLKNATLYEALRSNTIFQLVSRKIIRRGRVVIAS